MIEVEKNVDKYTPMVVFEDKEFRFANVHSNLPQPTSTYLLEVLFYAKKYGIYTWDESITLALAASEFNHITKKFLKNQESSAEFKNIDFTELDDIIRYNGTTLVVIPAGEEYKKLAFCHQHLISMGYSNDEISVLYRTEIAKGKDTNDYIKQHGLNNPISEKIKFYFVSLKFPKPLFRNKIKIDTIINFGTVNAHHTLRNFIKNHNNVLYYNETLKNYGNL
jgi:hypothetical protein